VHRYAADIPAPDFNLTGMQTGAERQADLLCGCSERQSAANGATRSVESRQNAVPCRLDQNPAMLLDNLLRQLIMTIQQATPCLIADIGDTAC
jgi:hypothetical protein